MTTKLLDVAGRKVPATSVSLDDLYILYQQFVETYGHVPRTNELDAKHNMPQMRIVSRVLESGGVTYGDFCLHFGKTSHVRASKKDYASYVQKLVDYATQHGAAPPNSELTKLGLPSMKWLIKNCPDSSVHDLEGFCRWAGIVQNKIYTKEEVIDLLKDYEEFLGHSIRYRDLRGPQSPVSGIVVNRLFGSLTLAKQELGLSPTPLAQPLPFEYYQSRLREIVGQFTQQTGRTSITWRDIENPLYSLGDPVSHKTYLLSFQRQGIDLRAYLKSLGVTMAPSNFSTTFTFDDGELTRSSTEYDFSLWLRQNGMEYQRDYLRDYKYVNFTQGTGRIDCDYYFPHINGGSCIEIAGIIYEVQEEDWRQHLYASGRENQYRDKMLLKERLLVEANVPYLFLFRDDMQAGIYQDKARVFLGMSPCLSKS